MLGMRKSESLLRGFRVVVILTMPYLTSFNSTAAMTSEPLIGAFTCSLNSQGWKPYNSIFATNVIMDANHRSVSDQELIIDWVQKITIGSFGIQ